MRMEEDIKRAIQREVAFYSNVGASVTFERTARHNVAVVGFSGESRRVVFPSTPSDWRSIRNAVSEVRRKMRDLGVFETEVAAPPVDPLSQADLVREARRAHFRSRYYQPEVGSFGAALIDAVAETSPLCPDQIAAQQPAPTVVETIRAAIPPPPEPPRLRPHRVAPPPEAEQPVIDLTPYVVASRVPALPPPEPAMEAETIPHPTSSPASADAAPVSRTRGKYLTEESRVKLTRLLILHGVHSEDDKTYTYNEGWSDEKVRDAVNPELGVDKIAEYRRKFFGATPAETEKAKPKTIETLMLTIAEQNEKITSLLARVKSLEETIAPLRT